MASYALKGVQSESEEESLHSYEFCQPPPSPDGSNPVEEQFVDSSEDSSLSDRANQIGTSYDEADTTRLLQSAAIATLPKDEDKRIAPQESSLARTYPDLFFVGVGAFGIGCGIGCMVGYWMSRELLTMWALM
jgi:hypothetical protein